MPFPILKTARLQLIEVTAEHAPAIFCILVERGRHPLLRDGSASETRRCFEHHRFV